MTQFEDIIVSITTELARAIIIMLYFRVFGEAKNRKNNLIAIVIAYIITTGCYIGFHNGIINIISTILGIYIIACSFDITIKKKILHTGMCFALLFIIDVLCAFLSTEAPDYNNYDIAGPFLSIIFFYLIVLMLRRVYSKDSSYNFSGQWYYLMIIAVMSCCVLYILYTDMSASRNSIIIIGTIMLIINIVQYHFYFSMVDRYKYEQENSVLKRQMDIYEQQISNDIKNSREIKAIRHDMKHHMRELYDMVDTKQFEDAKNYITLITNDIYSSQDVVNTGNFAFDGIFNYYTEQCREKGIRCDIKAIIPEELSIRAYDMNVIFGNLFDNAIENTMICDKPHIIVNVKYDMHTLYLKISNTYNGEVKKKGDIIISGKSGEHGYGLMNIERAIDKYSGSMKVSYNNDIFEVMIAIADY